MADELTLHFIYKPAGDIELSMIQAYRKR